MFLLAMHAYSTMYAYSTMHAYFTTPREPGDEATTTSNPSLQLLLGNGFVAAHFYISTNMAKYIIPWLHIHTKDKLIKQE